MTFFAWSTCSERLIKDAATWNETQNCSQKEVILAKFSIFS